MKEKNKTYTSTDLANYHAGKMPADEMHELEKAALEDPFLSDALDGYVYSQNIESDIAELQSRLNEKQKRRNVFTLHSVVQNKWWRIAALFIVIAGAGYLFIRINYINKENALVRNEIKSANLLHDSIRQNKNDTASTRDNIAFENQPALSPSRKEKIALPDVKSRVEKETFPGAKIQANVSSESKNNAANLNDKEKNFRKDYYAQAAPKYILKGKVTDDKGAPVGFATVKDNNSNKATLTDTTGEFLLQSLDSNTTATVSIAGYATKKVTLKKDDQPTIAMNKSDANLSEVVVTGFGLKKNAKKSDSLSSGLSGKVAALQVTKSKNRLQVYNDKFDEYLKKNITPIYDENHVQVTGEVSLSFTLNKKGRPKNIKVIESTCTPCEKEAIELLQNGPDWTGKKNKPATVVIKFQ